MRICVSSGDTGAGTEVGAGCWSGAGADGGSGAYGPDQAADPRADQTLFAQPCLFAVQAGSSAVHGLSVLAIWVLGGYLGGLLRAVWDTARSASDWPSSI